MFAKSSWQWRNFLNLALSLSMLHHASRIWWLPWLTMLWYAPSAIAKIWGGTWELRQIQSKRTQIPKWKNVEKLNSDLISPLAKIDLDGGGGVDGEPVVIKMSNLYHTLYIAFQISYIIYCIIYNIYCMWGTSCKDWSPRRRGQSRCRSAYSHILRGGWSNIISAFSPILIGGQELYYQPFHVYLFSSPGFEIVKHAGLVEVCEVAHILAALELGRVHLVWGILNIVVN